LDESVRLGGAIHRVIHDSVGAGQADGFAVQQQLSPARFDGAHAEAGFVGGVADFDGGGVEMRRVEAP
jgi:hypothetical protein